ncbi:SemiSWEET family transporter [Bifidobacterium aquikefiricola]|uniref:SemiSWEET family transporter n=1 Tax=Bifidobacterium aquikefiricola TaxID=3059038 RepID=A0AB39U7V2_9BIFI
MNTEKFFHYLSWVATTTGLLMYVSYIPQITNNLAGDKGSPVQPLVAAINCTLWVTYGLLKKPRDIPVALANAPGILFGLLAFFTAL